MKRPVFWFEKGRNAFTQSEKYFHTIDLVLPQVTFKVQQIPAETDRHIHTQTHNYINKKQDKKKQENLGRRNSTTSFRIGPDLEG